MNDASGDLRTLTWQQTVSTPRAFILFRLEPGAVQSFEGPLTFSIVRIESVDSMPTPPLEELWIEDLTPEEGEAFLKAVRS